MPRLAIVIPLTDPPVRFEETLASVLRDRPRDSRVLVPHAGTYVDPYDLAGEVEFLPRPAGESSAQLLNAAAEMAGAPVLHFLAPGYTPTPGWAEAALSYFAQADVAAVAACLVPPPADRAERTCGVAFTPGGRRRACLDPEPHNASYAPHFGASFYRTSVFLESGGFNPARAAMAEIDLARRLHRAGWHTVAALHCLLQGTPSVESCGGCWKEGVAAGRILAGAAARGEVVPPLRALLGELLAEFWKPAVWTHAAGVAFARTLSRGTDRDPDPLFGGESATIPLVAPSAAGPESRAALRYRRAG